LTSYAGNIPLGGSVALASTAATAIPAIYSGTITAVTAAGVYTGTFPINNAYVGQWVTISGFANPVNNGTFLCTASTTTTISLQTPFSVAASAQTGTMTLSAAYTCYTVAALAAPYMGQYFTVLGFTNAANNGTFQCVGGTGTTALYLTNTSGVTQTAQVATATLMPLYGVSITVSGFANAGNNGTFTCVGSTQHSLILSNAGGVAETNNASASFVAGSVPGTFMFNLTPSSIGVTTGAIGFNNTVANGDAITAIVLYPSVAPPQGFGGMIWTTVLEF
jgi:hypothetical protein